MEITHLSIGMIHSLIGKNDGVSIVIDQIVECMINDMGIELGNIYFLAAHTTPRFNAQTNEVFWHKNEIHKKIIENYSSAPPAGLDDQIHKYALYAKEVIKEWVESHSIDLIIAHNTSHPYNLITAIGLGYYIEELRDQGLIWPKLMVWWHDSSMERERFNNPNIVIKKYLKYLPGTYIDGLVFINKKQPLLAKKYFKEYFEGNSENFFKRRTSVIPNTSDITWDWHLPDWSWDELIYAEQDNYNKSFFKDLGLIAKLKKDRFTLEDTALLLQHTRVVPRKKIETAIDFAFRLEKKLREGKYRKKCVALVISGPAGDEMAEYRQSLEEYFNEKQEENPDSHVFMIFGEKIILSHRDIIVDRRYYAFSEIPSIIASQGGIGTYFSEIEGYGNNLLEMMSFALPVVVNRYEIFKLEIEPLGFRLPAIDKNELNDEVVDAAIRLLTDFKYRNETVLQNLEVLNKKLNHKVIARKLSSIIQDIFTKQL